MTKIKVLELVSGTELTVNKEDLIYVNTNQYKFDNPPQSDYDVLDYSEYFKSGEFDRCGYKDTPYLLSDDTLYQCEIIEEGTMFTISGDFNGEETLLNYTTGNDFYPDLEEYGEEEATYKNIMEAQTECNNIIRNSGWNGLKTLYVYKGNEVVDRFNL